MLKNASKFFDINKNKELQESKSFNKAYTKNLNSGKQEVTDALMIKVCAKECVSPQPV